MYARNLPRHLDRGKYTRSYTITKAIGYISHKSQGKLVNYIIRESDTAPDGVNGKKFHDLLCVVGYSIVKCLSCRHRLKKSTSSTLTTIYR